MTPPDGADIAKLLNVKFQGRALLPFTRHEMDAYRPGWRGTKGQPSAFVALSHKEVRLDRIPEQTDVRALQALVALTPKRDAIEVPDFLYGDWLEAIAHGARYRLMAIPGKPWTNHDLALFYMREFDKQIADARFKAAQGLGFQEKRLQGRRIV